MENKHIGAIFTHVQLHVLRMLVTQAAMSIQNAKQHTTITNWSTQLQQKNEELGIEITARHQAETSMRAAKEAAEKANTAKSAFVANLSHEIRYILFIPYHTITLKSHK